MGAQMLVSMAYYALPRTSKFTNLLLRLVIMLLHYFSIFFQLTMCGPDELLSSENSLQMVLGTGKKIRNFLSCRNFEVV